MAAASIARETNAIAMVVSARSIVRVFNEGELIAELIPELWMLSHYNPLLSRPHSERTENQLAVMSQTSQ